MSAFSSKPREVVISGVGVICPLGLSGNELWEGICQNRSGIRRFSLVPGTGEGGSGSEEEPVKVAAPIDRFTGNPEDFGPLPAEISKPLRKGLKLMSRESQMAVAAALRALQDAGWKPGMFDPQRCGVSFGCDYLLSVPEEFIAAIAACCEDGRFLFAKWGEAGLGKMNPLWLLKYLPNMPASHIAIYCQFCGPSNSITLREASALVGLGEAERLIADGHVELMVVGATGSWLHPMKMIHALTQQQVACDGDPETACCPFDRRRRGLVLGEGAAAVVVESRESAQARSAPIYGRIVTTAAAAAIGIDGQPHYRRALELVMQRLLERAGRHPEDIAFISAQGLGTRFADREEAQAIARAFGSRSQPVPVVATKSYFGHLGAGSAVAELIAGLMALKHRQLYPIRNYRVPDPDCPIRAAEREELPSPAAFVQLAFTPSGQAAGVLLEG
jgi:3-oxoacyl-[acyl-carrier-protein] synthase II